MAGEVPLRVPFDAIPSSSPFRSGRSALHSRRASQSAECAYSRDKVLPGTLGRPSSDPSYRIVGNANPYNCASPCLIRAETTSYLYIHRRPIGCTNSLPSAPPLFLAGSGHPSRHEQQETSLLFIKILNVSEKQSQKTGVFLRRAARGPICHSHQPMRSTVASLRALAKQVTERDI
jgi:hypothetical protein